MQAVEEVLQQVVTDVAAQRHGGALAQAMREMQTPALQLRQHRAIAKRPSFETVAQFHERAQ
jgi:hypothetical protein